MIDQKSWEKRFKEESEKIIQWRGEKKKASFNEIENQVEEGLARIRAKMLSELVAESDLRDFKGLAKKERPKCPSCGEGLSSNGKQKRKLVTTREEELEIERSKGYCHQCQVSFFPPR